MCATSRPDRFLLNLIPNETQQQREYFLLSSVRDWLIDDGKKSLEKVLWKSKVNPSEPYWDEPLSRENKRRRAIAETETTVLAASFGPYSCP